MGSVVDFASATKTGENKKENVCRPPIEVSRINSHAILVEFRRAFFNESRLDCAIVDVSKFQDYWRIVRVESVAQEYYNPNCYTYVIYVPKAKIAEADCTLRQALYLVTMFAYRSESQLKFLKEYTIDEMSKLYQLKTEFMFSITPSTVKLLRQANIYTLRDLVGLTREELCEVPGMTTTAVYDIERALSSIGWSMMASRIPGC